MQVEPNFYNFDWNKILNKSIIKIIKSPEIVDIEPKMSKSKFTKIKVPDNNKQESNNSNYLNS